MTDKQPPIATVTGTVEKVQIDTNGKPADGVLISFKTKSGVNGTVWLPRSSYSKDAALAAVRKQAEEYEGTIGAEV